MPSNPRYAIKQKLKAVDDELGRAEKKIIEVAQPYREIHPEYYEAFSSLLVMIDETRSLLKSISDKI